MKWRPIPAPPPPEVLLDERVGPHHVIVELGTHEGEPIFRAVQLVGGSRSLVGVSASSAEQALVQAARVLGYEPDDEAEPC